jgi:hypothetical protein
MKLSFASASCLVLVPLTAAADPPPNLDPRESWDYLMGRVDFGGGPGWNPCLVIPTEPTTWGRLKHQPAWVSGPDQFCLFVFKRHDRSA